MTEDNMRGSNKEGPQGHDREAHHPEGTQCSRWSLLTGQRRNEEEELRLGKRWGEEGGRYLLQMCNYLPLFNLFPIIKYVYLTGNNES